MNKRYVPLVPTGKSTFAIACAKPLDEFNAKDPGTFYTEQRADTLYYIVDLTLKEIIALQKKKGEVYSITRRAIDTPLDPSSYAKPANILKWNSDNYGPLKIPFPGEKINVTAENFKLFQNIPGIHHGENILKEKLYFVLGDNRHAAKDSRFIGLISHSKMVGIVK